MSWSLDTTVAAAIGWGLPTSPRLVPCEPYGFYGEIPNSGAHTLQAINGGEVLSFGSYGELYEFSGTMEICRPTVIKQDIVLWRFRKPAAHNVADMYIDFVDSHGANVYSMQIAWAPSFSSLNLSIIGKDPLTSVFQFGEPQPIILAFCANQLDPNWPLSFAWASGYTSYVSTEGHWRSWPSYVDNLGAGSLINGGIMDYIDSLYEGDYHGNEGLIAPTGGAGGGGGSFFRRSDSVGIPELPSISVCDTGMVSVYSVSTAQLQSLGAFLWDPNFFSNIVKLFQSPLDNIITLQAVPIPSGAMKGVAGNIIIGNVNTEIAANFRLTSTYVEINCGNIRVNEFYKNFADYQGFQELHLYLPYIGIVPINTDDCMSGQLNVRYHVDVFSGSCVAFINCLSNNGVWNVMAQYSGNVCAQFPITGANYSNVYIGAINSLSALSNGNMTGAVNAAMNMTPSYQRSGGVTSVSGIMGNQKPYLIYSTPRYITASNFGEVKGYTSNLTVTIGQQSGYLQATADNSELSGISNATSDELDLIRTMLSDGIYV